MTQTRDIVLTVRSAAALADMDPGDLASIIGTKDGPKTLKAGDVSEWIEKREGRS